MKPVAPRPDELTRPRVAESDLTEDEIAIVEGRAM